MPPQNQSDSATAWEDLEYRQDIQGGRQTFKTKRMLDARPRRLRTLAEKGWGRIGSYWLSPYTSHRYTEQAAIDIESLRGTFERQYRENARQRAA